MRKIDVCDGVTLEALGTDETEIPLIYIIFNDFPERQSVPIFAHEIKALIAGLTEAAVWLANEVQNGH